MPGLQRTGISPDHRMNITAEMDPEMQHQQFLQVQMQEPLYIPVRGIWEAL